MRPYLFLFGAVGLAACTRLAADKSGEGSAGGPNGSVPPPPPPPDRLTAGETRLLRMLGFQDADGDGFVRENEQPAYRNEPLNANQQTAFRLLAGVGGDRGIVDGEDMRRLQTDRKALARLLRGDPEYRGDILRAGSLESSGYELPPDLDRDGIPPVAHSRLMTYIQLAYRHVLSRSSLTVNGAYDRGTKATTARFQGFFGIPGEGGSVLGRTTLGALILHLEYDPRDLARPLQTVRDEMTRGRRQPFYLDPDNKTLSEQVVHALQYLYPQQVNPFEEIVGPGLRQQSDQLLEERYGGPLIGPNTLGQILEALGQRERLLGSGR